MGNQFSFDDKKKALNTATKVKNVLSPLSPKNMRTPKTSKQSKQTTNTPTATPTFTNNHSFTTPARRIPNQWLESTPSRDNYRFEDFSIDHAKALGEGAFACVKLGYHIPTKQQVAVKIITKSKIPADMKEYAITEPTYLSKLSHSNIINLLLTYEDEQMIYLFLEYVQGGDLYSLVESKGQLSQNLVKTLSHQIVGALNYCHQNNTCHRDIKLENILVEYNPSNETQSKAKLIDFGFAANIPEESYKFQDFPGSMLYAAPELLSGTPYNARVSDVYSLGVLLYVMLYGRYPFYSENNSELYYLITSTKPEFDSSFNSASTDLIAKMLHPDPNQRIQLHQVLIHPWFAKEKKDVLSPIKTKVNQLKCEVEKHSQNLRRMSLSPKVGRKNRT